MIMILVKSNYFQNYSANEKIIQSYLQMIAKYSLFHFSWQFWKNKLVTFRKLEIITLMFRCQFFKLYRKSTSNFIRIQKVLIAWRMSADSLVELFKGIGLSEAKAKDTVKNGNLSKNLEEAINFTQNAKISQVSQLCFLSCSSISFTNSWVHQSNIYRFFITNVCLKFD